MAKGNKGVFQSLKDIVCFKSNEDLVIRLKELSNLYILQPNSTCNKEGLSFIFKLLPSYLNRAP